MHSFPLVEVLLKLCTWMTQLKLWWYNKFKYYAHLSEKDNYKLIYHKSWQLLLLGCVNAVILRLYVAFCRGSLTTNKVTLLKLFWEVSCVETSSNDPAYKETRTVIQTLTLIMWNAIASKYARLHKRSIVSKCQTSFYVLN